MKKIDTNSFDHFFQEQLNPEQQQAVSVPSGALLVVAGAGSGKTRIITARIAHLMLKCGALPSSIVALTFTNKAAQEMKTRIARFLPNVAELPFVGTFHAYCLRFLKTHHDLLSAPFFSILDEDDQLKLINGIIKRHGMKKQITGRQLVYKISLFKNQSISPEQVSLLNYDRWLQELFQAYEREKRESKALDFDDLLLETVRLIKKHKEVKQTLCDSIAHVLVDEYQDTNVVQHELLKLLAQGPKKQLSITSLCVVGDEDQSIYSWRGATVANILNFKRDFSNTTMIKVEQNYRSVKQILDVANAVIQHNEKRNPKRLWSDRAGKDRIYQITCASEYQESDVVAAFFKKLTKQPKQTAAVLYRAHYQSRAIEESLIKQGIPYTIIGGVQFYERKEIKDLLAYLRLVCNPYDRAAFFRVINCPLRGLGESFETIFYDCWRQEPLFTFGEVANKLVQSQQLTKKKMTAVQQFLTAVQGINPSDRPSNALETIMANVQYAQFIRDTYDQKESESKVENIKELLYAMKHFETEGIDTVGSFLDEVALLREKIAIAKQEGERTVVLMTLHAAKGLEFDAVAIIGLNEETLPSSRSIQDDDALEEERRLFYVGITRAKERLLLSHTRCRYTYGQMSDCLPSRFLREIPISLFARHEIAYAAPAHIEYLFDMWLHNGKNRQDGLITFGAAKRVKKADTMHVSEIKSSGEWKKHQPVAHPKFGIGIIEDIECKRDGMLYVTARFKVGKKKISANFLKKV